MTADEVKAWEPVLNFLATIVAVVVGGILTHLTTSRRDSRNREIETRERREQQWTDNQIESLRALQDAAQGMMSLPVASIMRSEIIDVHKTMDGKIRAFSDFAAHKISYHDLYSCFVKHQYRIDCVRIRQAAERFLNTIMIYYENCGNGQDEQSGKKATHAGYHELNRLVGDRIHELIRRDRSGSTPALPVLQTPTRPDRNGSASQSLPVLTPPTGQG